MVESCVFTDGFVTFSILLRGLEMFFVQSKNLKKVVIKFIPRRVFLVFEIFPFLQKYVETDF